MDNAFFNVNIGGWKYGIWGLCPSEILHQFYEGLISYSLEFFSKQFLKTEVETISILGYKK